MTFSDAVAVFGRLHPLVLHLPIGVLAGAAMLEALSLVRPQLGLRPAVGLLLGLAALAAMLTASSGWMLAREDGYGGDTLELHRWLGLSLAAATALTAVLHIRAKRSAGQSAAYRSTLAATLILLVPAGHFGGTLTHGEGFVTAPLFTVAQVATPAPSVARTAFEVTVRPTLEANCVGCHGEKKRKGGLSLASADAIRAGGKDGAVVVAGDPAASELVRRMRLPLDDDDHMPPEGKRQPSEAQIAAVEAWIGSGASFTDETLEAVPLIAEATTARPPTPNPAPTPQPSAATEEQLAALRAALVHAEPVEPNSHLLWIDFAAPASAGTADDAFVCPLLRPIVAHVRELSLGGSSVTDTTLELLATIPNLRRLDLRGSAVTDAGIAKLAKLASLEDLSLVRTKVSDASIDVLLAMPALRRVFLWSSAVTPDGLRRLREGKGDLVADAGDTADSTALEVEPKVELGKAAPPTLASAAPSAAAPATLTPVNTVCPISGSPIDPRYTIVFEGKVIGFCCPNCPKKFWDDPKAFVDKLR